MEENELCKSVCPNRYEAVEAYCENCELIKNTKGMELNEYQKKAMTTCMATSNNISYMALNLVGEVGEFASKLAKLIRKGIVVINGNDIYFNHSVSENEKCEILDSIKKELGDIAWQLSGCCGQFGFTLEDVCQDNLDKLLSRKERNVIDGDGDYR